MVNTLKIKEDIVKVSLGINILSLIISIFAFSKAFFISVMAVNILLGYTFIMMTNFGEKFIAQYSKMWGAKSGKI